ncbi:MAG TPA: PQQ-binding-like beta-propeller repeat protein [Acidimicrobiia bacterium]|nr:PQQ-binding-like beta-propeller repeat protein [Acidimicrobiia bacterium]
MTEQQTRSALSGQTPRRRSENQARRQARLVTVVLLVVAAAVAVWLLLDVFSGDVGGTASPSSFPASAGESTVATTTIPAPQPVAVPAESIGAPWGTTQGVTMFRGNPTRSWFGRGALAATPQLRWSYPEGEMCSVSVDLGEESEWCGTGWTGQPLVWTNLEGTTELLFGGYDGAVHFVDAATGEPTREPFPTGDLIKGFGAIDPDGYPLLYFGSRDNKFRIVALDREPVSQVWSMDAFDVDGLWNDDWDSSPAIVDGILYVGGENGWFYAIELNRTYGDQGRVRVRPEVLFSAPTYDAEFLEMLNEGKPRPPAAELPRDGSGSDLDYDVEISVENSPVFFRNRVYVANSAGRILGFDISDIREGRARVVFDYWAGGDIDGTMAVDSRGRLIVPIEFEPNDKAGKPPMSEAEAAHQREVGQLVKLDPYADGDPRLWGVDLTAGGENAGIWASPVLYEGLVYVPTHTGELLAVSAANGEVVWRDSVGPKTWSSPVIVGDQLIQATFASGIRGYSLADPRHPERLWTVELPESGEVESTPVVWEGTLYVGSRNGFFYAVGE